MQKTPCINWRRNSYRTNAQVRLLHNIKAVQSRKGWTLAEVEKAMADAKAGIAYEFCEICKLWKPIDSRSEHHVH